MSSSSTSTYSSRVQNFWPGPRAEPGHQISSSSSSSIRSSNSRSSSSSNSSSSSTTTSRSRT